MQYPCNGKKFSRFKPFPLFPILYVYCNSTLNAVKDIFNQMSSIFVAYVRYMLDFRYIRFSYFQNVKTPDICNLNYEMFSILLASIASSPFGRHWISGIFLEYMSKMFRSLTFQKSQIFKWLEFDKVCCFWMLDVNYCIRMFVLMWRHSPHPKSHSLVSFDTYELYSYYLWLIFAIFFIIKISWELLPSYYHNS